MRSWFYWPGTTIIGFVARLLWGAEVEGVEHIPREGPFILVANHASNLDPPILGWAIGHRTDRLIHFMAKAEMLRWPVLGWLADAVGRLLRAARRGRPIRAALRARGVGRGPPDRAVPGGHALARRAPEGRQVRRGVPGHAVGRPAAAGGDRRDAADLPRWLEVAASEPHVHPGRGAVHAPARSRWPDRPPALADGTERIMGEIEAAAAGVEQRRFPVAAGVYTPYLADRP